MWWWTAVALAGDLPWAGDWGLDPTQSDKGPEQIEAIVLGRVGVGTGQQAAASMSPDPTSGQDLQRDDKRRMVDSLKHLMSRSGQIVLADAEEGVTVTYSGEEPVTLTFGRKWAKVDWGDRRVRMRAWKGRSLTIERRIGGASVTETFLPSTEPEEVAVVVRIEGSGVQQQEFRRIYRLLTQP